MSSDLRASIERHSKSFALASRLLPPAIARDAAVLYAYCRHVDDLIDGSPDAAASANGGAACGAARPNAVLQCLQSELSALYSALPAPKPLIAIQHVVQARAIPRAYFDDLLAGMAMDAYGTYYRTFDDLLLYAYRVAGTIGLMMCHVMGVRHSSALRNAAQLGIAMQLTNIARDVHEDWTRRRVYLPEDILAQHGVPALRPERGETFPSSASQGVARATAWLLERADAYYRSADAGIVELSARCGLAIHAARLVYSEIGACLRAQHCDPLAPRAIVSRRRKWRLVGRAGWLSFKELPAVAWLQTPRVPSEFIVRPESVFLL
jgi:phytoene synthase